MDLKKRISFTTTALTRPDILNKTIKSFSANIKESLKDFTLLLNIDPIPDHRQLPEMLEVASMYFGNVISNTPRTPNFAKAVKWCWSRADTEFIFHLEDDWMLNINISLEDLINRFDKNTLQVILPAYNYKYEKMALSPSVIKSSAFKLFASKMVDDINPEVQLRNKDILDVKPNNIKAYSNKVVVSDIGRKWASEKRLIKPKKCDFIRY